MALGIGQTWQFFFLPKIFSFASIGSEPQDLKYQGEKTNLVIGKNNTISSPPGKIITSYKNYDNKLIEGLDNDLIEGLDIP